MPITDRGRFVYNKTDERGRIVNKNITEQGQHVINKTGTGETPPKVENRNVKSFQKKVLTQTSTTKHSLKTLVSTSRHYLSTLSFKRKIKKTVKSFKLSILTSASILKKPTKLVSSFAENMVSSASSLKKKVLITKSFTNNVISKVTALSSKVNPAPIENGTVEFPYLIKNEEDLRNVRNDLTSYYKQVADITLTSTFFPIGSSSSPFRGGYDGGGFKIINLSITAGANYVGLFSNVTGTSTRTAYLRNIMIENPSIQASSYTNAGILAGNTGSYVKVENIMITGGFITASSSTSGGVIGTAKSTTTLRNQFNDILLVNTRVNASSSTGGGFAGEFQYTNVTNAIILLEPTSTVRYGFAGGSNNNYTFSNCGSTKSNTATGITFITDVNRTNKSFYETSFPNIIFGANQTWNMVDGSNPYLTIFVKVVEKIEQRLVEAYSKIVDGGILRYKGRLDSVKSFTRKVTGKTSRFIASMRNTLSFAKKSSSNLQSKKKANKKTKTFTRKVLASVTAGNIKKIFRQVKSYARSITSKTSRKKKAFKTHKSWTHAIHSGVVKYRGVIRNTTTYTKQFASNVKRNIGKLLSVKSFSRRVNSKSAASILTRFVATVKSYSKPMVSKIRRFSNIFNFAVKTVKGHANVIVSYVERGARVKEIVKSYTGKIQSFAKMLYRVASPVNVLAIVKHRFSQTRLFKRENKTDINKK